MRSSLPPAAQASQQRSGWAVAGGGKTLKGSACALVSSWRRISLPGSLPSPTRALWKANSEYFSLHFIPVQRLFSDLRFPRVLLPLCFVLFFVPAFHAFSPFHFPDFVVNAEVFPVSPSSKSCFFHDFFRKFLLFQSFYKSELQLIKAHTTSILTLPGHSKSQEWRRWQCMAARVGGIGRPSASSWRQ